MLTELSYKQYQRSRNELNEDQVFKLIGEIFEYF